MRLKGERKRIEKEMKELEEKLEKKRIEKKEIELEKEDLRIRKDSIIRLSNTPTTQQQQQQQLIVMFLSFLMINFFQLFFKLQLILFLKEVLLDGLKPKKGVICCDGGGDSFHFVSSFPLKNEPCGVSVNSDGNIFICEDEYGGLKSERF